MPKDTILYQDLFLYSERQIRKYLLFSDNIKTIIPAEIEQFKYQHNFFDTCSAVQFDFELYKRINDAAGEEVVDYFVIPEVDRLQLVEDLFAFLCNAINIPELYEILKWPKDFHAQDHWLLMGNIEEPLVDLLLEANIAQELAHPVLTIKTCSIFDEIIANYLRGKYKFELIASDPNKFVFDQNIPDMSIDDFNCLQTISHLVPDLYCPDLINNCPLNDFFAIRNELLPHRKQFLKEINEYKLKINESTNEGDNEGALDLLTELTSRINSSFFTFNNFATKILKKLSLQKTNIILSGIRLAARSNAEIGFYCDYIQLMINCFNLNSKEKISTVGFDYLVGLDSKAKLNTIKNSLLIK